MVRVIICDDQQVVCEGLRVILGSAPGIEVVGVAYDGAQVLELVSKTKADVVLMDLRMPKMNGIQATRLLRQQHPEVRVLVLTTYDADEWVFDAVRAGAAGYLLKDAPREELLSAVKGTAEGKTHVDPAVAGKLFAKIVQGPPPLNAAVFKTLTERERELLRLLAEGMTNAEIARRLHLSEGTVRNYVSSILAKLGVSDRTQAVAIAFRHGLVDFDGT